MYQNNLLLKFQIASVSSQLGNIYMEALCQVGKVQRIHERIIAHFQVSNHVPALYADVSNVLLTPLPLPTAWSRCKTSSLLQSVENILLADLPGSCLPNSTLVSIISKVQLTLLACMKLSPCKHRQAEQQLETLLRHCQASNYGDVALCFGKTRDINN